MSLLLFWGGMGIIFLIIEMLTSTFYGLSLAVSSFIVLGYVALTGDTDISLIQGVIFVLSSFLSAWIIPKVCISKK